MAPGPVRALTLPDGTLVGHAGELHPKVVAALGLPAAHRRVELDLDVLTVAPRRPVAGPHALHLPGGPEDVALVVDASVPAAAVRARAAGRRRPALESLALFDVYRGEQLGEGGSPWPTGSPSGRRTAR